MKIYLGGEVVVVSEKDSWLLIKYKWNLDSRGYVRRSDWTTGTCKSVYLHRDIMGEPPTQELEIDHINGNKLDNRRQNLRWATRSQNMANRKVKPNEAGFKGVYRHNRKWKARIKWNGKLLYLGLYATKEQAAVAYDQAAIKYYGEFANLNFPDGLPKEYQQQLELNL